MTLSLAFGASMIHASTRGTIRQQTENQTRWRAVHLMSPGHDGLPLVRRAIVERMVPMGVNVLILEVDYGFSWKSHPELATPGALTREDAEDLAELCRARGIRLIPLFNCLGHQSWAKSTFPLLTKHPEFDETPDIPTDNPGIYCRSWCPQHPGVNKVVFALMDELLDAFKADALHVGMDEVFLIAYQGCPRCRGQDPARLFARAVNDYHNHLVRQRGVTMLMWGDRFLDDAVMHYGQWESSRNGTAPAVDMVPKDIVICDWHYEKRDDYPSIPFFLGKGFRVLPSSWRNADAALALLESGLARHDSRMLGHLCTTWAGGAQIARVLLGESRQEGQSRDNAREAVFALELCMARLGCEPDRLAITQKQAQEWRAERRLVDMHQHVDYREDHLRRCIGIMDKVGIGLVVNLSGGAVTHAPGETSEFERNRQSADKLFPGRFLHYFSLDYNGWDEPDWPERAVAQVNEAFRLGAAGLKEYKRLGLYLRDRTGKLIQVDDPKLDAVWKRCGELGMPVSIHVADPQAFWKPYNESNERWKELKDHPSWWFGDTNKYPSFEALVTALNRVIGRHPQTTFVCVHFANNAEDLDWVERSLDKYPNMMADLAARIPEIGRHDPARVRRLFLKHQDRILFGTDFQVYDRLILGSSGKEPPPTDDAACAFFAKHWRWLETTDRQFEHMTPIQGDWKIDAIGLPPYVLRKIYFDNARRLLLRSLPAPVVRAVKIKRDFKPDGKLAEAVWQKASAVHIECTLKEGRACPELSTVARVLWSDRYLYIGFESPYSELTVFMPPNLKTERLGLWDKDVVEAFIGADPANRNHYTEFEVAPTGEKLDLVLDLPAKDFAWSSGFDAAVQVDRQRRVWTTEMRIPLAALSSKPPAPGDRWSLNLYRHDIAHGVFLAWNPTGTASAHTPTRFGVLEFGR
ncbi:MAG: amidohydrolase family protein [Verrucomicrobiota bacterium]|nr:amidohydrolase family protein [Verrucomicrobiota bacterium]